MNISEAGPTERRPTEEIPSGSLISVTGIHLKETIKPSEMIAYVRKILPELDQAEGRLYSDYRSVGDRNYLTITIWRDRDSLMRFKHSPEHAAAMAEAERLADSTPYTYWIGDKIPTWEEATERLAEAEREKQRDASA